MRLGSPAALQSATPEEIATDAFSPDPPRTKSAVMTTRRKALMVGAGAAGVGFGGYWALNHGGDAQTLAATDHRRDGLGHFAAASSSSCTAGANHATLGLSSTIERR